MLHEEEKRLRSIHEEPTVTLLSQGGVVEFPDLEVRFIGQADGSGNRVLHLIDIKSGKRVRIYPCSAEGLRGAKEFVQRYLDRQVRISMELWEQSPTLLPSSGSSIDEVAFKCRNLGKAILETRLARGWSRSNLAKAINISKATLALIEEGKEPPTNLRLWIISDLLETDLSELLKKVNLGAALSDLQHKRDPRALDFEDQ